jgi:ADP-ribose pyrophosphatase
MTGRTYTCPSVYTDGVTHGWAEVETDPTRIDWPARQAVAAIPFKVIDHRPVNPCEQTAVRYGRNEMGFWGENLMADALVTVTFAGVRHLLLVERGDGYGWAVPGGAVDPGETGLQAAIRELEEETGLIAAASLAKPLEARYVPDPRNSGEAWAVTLPVSIGHRELAFLPAVTGGDDARRAEWIPAVTYSVLTEVLDAGFAGTVFAAHVAMLKDFLGGES